MTDSRDDRRFMVDVGLRDMPFPIRAVSRVEPDGQATVANISINARIMQTFEARWIDRFIHVLHSHRENIGTRTLRHNLGDYITELEATAMKIAFDYPFFIAKRTPVSGEMCLVRYLCEYAAKAHSVDEPAAVTFRIQVPCITTYPASNASSPTGLFGQLSVLDISVQSQADVYPEDIVDMVDRHVLASVYSFLSEDDQRFIIEKVHSEEKTSVVVVDEVRKELARDRNIEWYAIDCSNYGMLHSYSTIIRTEKSAWVPFSGFDEHL
ncbi:GTP cyclohydrolase, FolE2/MptA family [Anaerobaca lacustris]|uniref:GTP cyclohydrolase, FolE2/MptA family n=1 Tax=Anaerobaca lacustris TaxID=3044600 RepID=A0AAW6TUX4_9BACT|nr:GTP cyclohydrolase, FolE2/MptA family [Sedimentisphaerales bacterium M17dextr]